MVVNLSSNGSASAVRRDPQKYCDYLLTESISEIFPTIIRSAEASMDAVGQIIPEFGGRLTIGPLGRCRVEMLDLSLEAPFYNQVNTHDIYR